MPGATVTATQGEKKLVAITNEQGGYSFADIDDGVWKFQVEMFGFATQTQDITIAADTPSTVWELKLLSAEEMTRGVAIVTPQSLASAAAVTSPATANAATSSAALPSAPTPNAPAAPPTKSASTTQQPAPAQPPAASPAQVTMTLRSGPRLALSSTGV